MFSHHSSIHHFTNDPPSPKSKTRIIHLEDGGDLTPTQEFTNPFNKEKKTGEKVSVSSIQGLGILLYLLPTHLYLLSTHVKPRILRTSTQHLYDPAVAAAPHHTFLCG